MASNLSRRILIFAERCEPINHFFFLWFHEVKCCAFLQKLYGSFEEDLGYFQFATALTSSDIDEIQKFLDASVDIG